MKLGQRSRLYMYRVQQQYKYNISRQFLKTSLHYLDTMLEIGERK